MIIPILIITAVYLACYLLACLMLVAADIAFDAASALKTKAGKRRLKT